MTLTARPRFLIRFAVLAALALCGVVLALSSTGTPPVGAQDGSAPAKPTGVVTTATHDSVALAWDDPSDASITHYQIFRRDRDVHDAGEFVTIQENTGSAAASYTDDTVEPEKRYVYRVKAVNQHGASTWSNFVQADTPAAPDPADFAPSGLEVSLVENRVTLTWDAPASDAASVTGYEILRRRPNDGEAALTTLVADTGNAETGYTDDTANEPGVRYTYRVKALRDGEQSRVSNYDRIDLPDDYAQDTPGSDEPTPSPEALAPSGLTAEAAKGGGVALSWTAPAEDAGSVTGYEVLRARGNAELTTLEADTGSTDTTYTDETATAAGETYAYQVKALRGEEKSQVSNRASITLPDEESARGAGDATGVPTISGTPAVGELLTADTSTIGDPDGIADADFEYQWIAFDGTTDSDISGATGETYRPLLAHLDQTIKVRVSFDDDDNAESLTSAATTAVSASTYGQVIWAATLTVEEETVAAGTFFGFELFGGRGSLEPVGFTYDGVANFVTALQHLEGSTLRFTTNNSLGSGDFNLYLDGSPILIESPGMVRLLVFSDHGLSWTDEQEVEVRLTVNRPATGAPAITGMPEVGETLTAGISGIMDEDGLPVFGELTYQWISNDGTDDSDIDGATDSTYAVVQADAGKTIKVRVSFTDNAKFPESLTSAATAAVTVPVAALVSNVGQTAAGNANVTATQSQGQGFTTGSDSGGYTLGSVELAVSSFSGTASDITVSIYSESSGDPGTVVHTLTTPASISTPVTTFTAPSDTTLAAGTTYYVVISTTGSGINLSRTNATAEDTGGASGWSIADSRRYLGSGAWVTTTSPIRMRVNGATATTSTDIWSATLTVGIGVSFYGYSGIIDVGDLEPAEFTYNGNPATVQVLAYSGNVFYLQTSPALGSGDYLLLLDDTPIQLGAASGSPARHQVSDHGLTWTADQQVEVRLIPNQAATGAPVITGTAQVGETLTADTSNIGDPDSIDNADFSYQWVRNDDSDIDGATDSTYTLVEADAGKTITVRVSFTDDNDFPESLTSAPTVAILEMGVTGVPSTWSLVPSGLEVGDKFRLLFISSSSRNAAPTSIATYNTWIQNQAAAGHTDIQDYSDTFRVVGSTADVDARDNTHTTYTSNDKGVRIYWLNGNKVVDEYEDFYDGGWDDEANMKTEDGDSTSPSHVYTGSDDDGTEAFGIIDDASRALGVTFVALGKPNQDGAQDGPLYGGGTGRNNANLPFYGLSGVFQVVDVVDRTGPTLTGAFVDSNGDRIELLFDEFLDTAAASSPPTSAFAVTADGAPVAVGSVLLLNTLEGSVLLSQLTRKIYQGQTVTVTYTDPNVGNDEAAVQDEAGNDTASFTTGEDDVPAVTNDSTVEPPKGTLVSNAERTIEGAISSTIQAQSFVTGPWAGGYTLSMIQIRLGDDSTLPGVTDLIAAVKVDDGSGEPGALVAKLANPASLTNDALNTFAAPVGTTLAPNTTYWVVVNEERGDSADWVNLRVTAQDEEDEALPGWSIGNSRLSKASASGSWSHSATVSNLIVVSGSVIVGTPDRTGPTLTGAFVDSNGDRIELVFDEFLDIAAASSPPTSAFAVTADGAPVAVGSVLLLNTLDGSVLLRQLTPVIYQGQDVTITYTDPTVGNDVAAIQDEAGNDTASFTTGEDDVPAVTNDSTLVLAVPGAPTGLTATPNGATQIDLNWTAPADNGGDAITGYQIEYSDDGGTSWSVLVADTQSTDTMYSDTTLSGGETRHYRVSAINSIGIGAASNNPPTGKPTISGTPQVNQTLTADISGIMDVDGLPAADRSPTSGFPTTAPVTATSPERRTPPTPWC